MACQRTEETHHVRDPQRFPTAAQKEPNDECAMLRRIAADEAAREEAMQIDDERPHEFENEFDQFQGSYDADEEAAMQMHGDLHDDSGPAAPVAPAAPDGTDTASVGPTPNAKRARIDLINARREIALLRKRKITASQVAEPAVPFAVEAMTFRQATNG